MNDKSMSDRADLSSAIWKRDSGCGAGGCSCGCCHRGGAGERPPADDPRGTVTGIGRAEDGTGNVVGITTPEDWKRVESGINVMSKVLQDLGISLDLPTLWPKLSQSGDSNSNNNPSDDLNGSKSVTVSNGDHLMLGGMHGFNLVDKDGNPVTEVRTLDSGAMDAPVEHLLSNGAIYRSRGGWNHDESITWPNADVVRFSDSGKFQSYEPHDGA
jgi:hypothetical protein